MEAFRLRARSGTPAAAPNQGTRLSACSRRLAYRSDETESGARDASGAGAAATLIGPFDLNELNAAAEDENGVEE